VSETNSQQGDPIHKLYRLYRNFIR